MITSSTPGGATPPRPAPGTVGPAARNGEGAGTDPLLTTVLDLAERLRSVESGAADAVRAELSRSSSALHERASRDHAQGTVEDLALIRAWGRVLGRLSALAPPTADEAPPPPPPLAPSTPDPTLAEEPTSTLRPTSAVQPTADRPGDAGVDVPEPGDGGERVHGERAGETYRKLALAAQQLAASDEARCYELSVPTDPDTVDLWQWIHLALLRLPRPDEARQRLYQDLGVEVPQASDGRAIALPDLPATGLGGVPLGEVLPEVEEALGAKADRFRAAAIVVSDVLRLVELADVDRTLHCGLWDIIPMTSHLPLTSPELRNRYRKVVLERLVSLASKEKKTEPEAYAMMRVHETVASVYPWPLPEPTESWWAEAVTTVRTLLTDTVALIPPAARPTTQPISPGPDVHLRRTRRTEDILVQVDPPASRVLRELRVYYTARDDDSAQPEPGRCIRTTGPR